MRMHFSRNDSGETSVQLIHDGKTLTFSYISLVKHLIENSEIEPTTFTDAFSDQEQASVNSMTRQLVEACKQPAQPLAK